MQKRFPASPLQQVFMPPQYLVRGSISGNEVVQVGRLGTLVNGEVIPYQRNRVSGFLIVDACGMTTLVTKRKVKPPSDIDQVLVIPDGTIPSSQGEYERLPGRPYWLNPREHTVGQIPPADRHMRRESIRSSWESAFHFKHEVDSHGSHASGGLRTPQIGAVHAALAHWASRSEPATIVMPTGTGKTETMLALLAIERMKCLLVVVPSDPLRKQTADKFTSWGVLQAVGVIDSSASFPIVGVLKHRLATPQQVDDLFLTCNVVVATMQVISQSGEEARQRMTELVSHLFIDEAHHVAAPTWDGFRSSFTSHHILQFTATPFRNDGKHLPGRIIFDYPLAKAQAEGYFRPITFVPIRAYTQSQADMSIAEAAIQQLQMDRSAGFDHVIMARVDSIQRAEEVLDIYQRIAPHLEPIVVHSQIGAADRREALRKLNDGVSHVIVCVNMLGEGYDEPRLKIAAMHDIHKSLAITLQFTGRFTRTQPNIGSATMIARYPEERVHAALRSLYAEDADWNMLLPPLATGATDRELERTEFIDNFGSHQADIPLQNIFPKMSTVVYRDCHDWEPYALAECFDPEQIYAGPVVNAKDRVALVIIKEQESVPWGDIRDIWNVDWTMYLLYWDEQLGLLYINSSNNISLYQDIAVTVCGDQAHLIRGEAAFRVLHGINRLLLMNLGLRHSISRAVRFTMYVGPDIRDGLAEAVLQNKIKSNIFARGFEDGDRMSMGCSFKGRIWSHQVAKGINEWTRWCDRVGRKVTDDTISVEALLEDAMVPIEVSSQPSLVPLAIEWPSFLERPEDAMFISINDALEPMYAASIELLGHSSSGPIQFRVTIGEDSASYEVCFGSDGVSYIPLGRMEANVKIGHFGKQRPLSEWFLEESPIIHFENRTMLIHNILLEPKDRPSLPFDPNRIITWDWSGVDLKKESQTAEKRADSIQFHVISRLLDSEWAINFDIVFDDDDSGEAADVVAIKRASDRLLVHLFHCKYSHSAYPGARVEDLYEVCGQAQRSVVWRRDSALNLLRHLRVREMARLERHESSRFEKGNLRLLEELILDADIMIPDFVIHIVQPGLSAKAATQRQLELLAGTELYLQETYNITFGVIASA